MASKGKIRAWSQHKWKVTEAEKDSQWNQLRKSLTLGKLNVYDILKPGRQ